MQKLGDSVQCSGTKIEMEQVVWLAIFRDGQELSMWVEIGQEPRGAG